MYIGDLMCFFIMVIGVTSSHFRGGMMSIDSTKDTDMTQINYRFSWQQSYTKDYFCNASTVAAAKTINAEGELTTIGGCTGRNLTTVPLKCTDYSEVDDWMSGTYSLEFECKGSFISLSYKGRQWPTLKNGGNHWSLFLNASLTVRSDTNKVNRSPVSLMQPIIHLLQGCQQNVSIPVVDNDGDTIRCRWSSSDVEDECGGICSKMPGMTLNENKCSLIFTPNVAEVGTYALAIQVEDFMRSNDTIPISSVPVQFLTKVIGASASCTSMPKVTDSKDKIIGIPSGSAFEDRVDAEAEDQSHRIVAIDIIGPEGLERSALQHEQDNRGKTKWFVHLIWLPKAGQEGKHILCYTAVNDMKISSPPECKELHVDTGMSIDENQEKTTAGTSTNLDETDNSTLATVGKIGSALGGISTFIIAIVTVWKCRNKPVKRKKETDCSM